jgi:hypothetical protein
VNPRLCASCGSGADADASFCWLCGYPLGTAESPAPPVAAVTAAPPLDGAFWVLGFVLALLVMLAVALELALVWPGLLIPYSVVLVPVVVVMSRIVYVQRLDFWRPQRRAVSGAGPSAGPESSTTPGAAVDTRNRGDGGGGGSDVVGDVVTALAIGMGGVLIVVGLLILLATAAFIILVAICLGTLAAYGV